MDTLTIALSVSLGAALGALIIFLIMKRGKKEKNQKKKSQIFKTGLKKRINTSEMEKARKDLNSVILEKDLISSALTRVYEAEVNGNIDRSEREALSSRYKKRLKEVEEKFGDAEITIEVGELERLRDELMNLFETKINQINNRLHDASIKLDKMKRYVAPIKTIEKIEKKSPSRSRTINMEEIEVDDKVKALREEVLEALARLEQMDIEN